MDDRLIKALRLAQKLFGAKTDLAGAPYIGHLERVAKRVKTTSEKTVAFLHDAIEDTGISAQQLLQKGFSKDIVNAVQVLTHKDGDNYFIYIFKIIRSRNRLATRVKAADLRDNMNLGRLSKITAGDIFRTIKYFISYILLKIFG